MKHHPPGEPSIMRGILLLLISSVLLLSSVYIWFANNTTYTMIPLSVIPLVIFCMIKYVTLRLWLRN